MDEIHRKYHAVADLFPLMQGDEYKAVKASTIINGHIISIFPSTYKGYFYVTHVEGQTGIYEYLSKPVHYEYLIEVLAVMGIDASNGQWSTEKCQPLAIPPYTNVHPTKRLIPLVYFIRGAGKVKIGVAENPRERLYALQTGSPIPLQLLATCEGGYKRESELHKQFAHLRLHGEWFEGTQELLSFIEGTKC